MRYRLQRHDGTDCSATMVPFTVLRMVPIQRYRHVTVRCCCETETSALSIELCGSTAPPANKQHKAKPNLLFEIAFCEFMIQMG